MTKLYRLKPIEWKGADDYFSASVRGGYRVEHDDDLGWRWGYCWDEHYDEDLVGCDSLEDGKQKAEEHYRERILSMLEEVETIAEGYWMWTDTGGELVASASLHPHGIMATRVAVARLEDEQ